MGTSSRLTIALHTLALIALESREGNKVTSGYIARSVNTNPVALRRLLGMLRAAKLVRSKRGARGGWTLARPAKAIGLDTVYRAVEAAPLFAMHRRPPSASCQVGRSIQQVLRPHFAEARVALESHLRGLSVADVLREVQAAGPAREGR